MGHCGRNSQRLLQYREDPTNLYEGGSLYEESRRVFPHSQEPNQLQQEALQAECGLVVAIGFSWPLQPSLQRPKSPFYSLPNLGKSQKIRFTRCPTWARAKKFDLLVAQLGQGPKSSIYSLPNLGEGQKVRFTRCPTWASVKKFDFPFAQLGQGTKSSIFRLPNLGKGQKV